MIDPLLDIGMNERKFTIDRWQCVPGQRNIDSTSEQAQWPACLMSPLDVPYLIGEPGNIDAAQSLPTGNIELAAATRKDEPGMHLRDVDDSTESFGIDDRDRESNSMPARGQGHITLRDAKQVLAELAEERKKKKQKKALASARCRNRPRRPAKGFESKVSPLTQHEETTEEMPISVSTPSCADRQTDPTKLQETIPSVASPSHPSLSSCVYKAPCSSPLIPDQQSPPSIQRAPTGIPSSPTLEPARFVLHHTSFSPTLTQNTGSISATTDNLWVILLQDPMCRKVRELLRRSASGLEGNKLRVLAHMEYLPSWWLLREKVVELSCSKGVPVNDEEMVQMWAQHEAMAGF